MYPAPICADTGGPTFVPLAPTYPNQFVGHSAQGQGGTRVLNANEGSLQAAGGAGSLTATTYRDDVHK